MLRRDFSTTSLIQAGFDCIQALRSLAKGISNTQMLIQATVMTHHQILLPSQTETGDAALLFTGSVCLSMEVHRVAHSSPSGDSNTSRSYSTTRICWLILRKSFEDTYL